MQEGTKADADVRRRGRRVAATVFYVLVVVFIVIPVTQLSMQLFASGKGGAPVDCRSGIVELARAVETARAASEHGEASPDAALARFRAALSPAWDGRDRVLAACRASGDPKLLDAFDTIERLRYAEENVVRRDARDLSPLRRRVRELMTGLLGAAPSPPAAPAAPSGSSAPRPSANP